MCNISMSFLLLTCSCLLFYQQSSCAYTQQECFAKCLNVFEWMDLLFLPSLMCFKDISKMEQVVLVTIGQYQGCISFWRCVSSVLQGGVPASSDIFLLTVLILTVVLFAISHPYTRKWDNYLNCYQLHPNVPCPCWIHLYSDR